MRFTGLRSSDTCPLVTCHENNSIDIRAKFDSFMFFCVCDRTLTSSLDVVLPEQPQISRLEFVHSFVEHIKIVFW